MSCPASSLDTLGLCDPRGMPTFERRIARHQVRCKNDTSHTQNGGEAINTTGVLMQSEEPWSLGLSTAFRRCLRARRSDIKTCYI